MANIHVIPANRQPVKGDILLRHLWKNQQNECISWWRYSETITIDNVVQYTTLNGSFRDIVSSFKAQNLYITNLEKPESGDWYFDIVLNKAFKCESERHAFDLYHTASAKKIILTSDLDLIADGVQVIPDDFLNWFVKNPTCETVDIRKKPKVKAVVKGLGIKSFTNGYDIIIPKKLVQIDQNNPATKGSTALVYKQEPIPELTNLIMMVSMDGKNWKKRNVIALSKGIYITSAGIKTCAHTDEEFTAIDYWRFAKTI